jgi:nitroimidazol reductase NimA-like FMN-containing flavoprotein (pyridoxamine 5'-phosphate oxidase superfamily)
MADAGETLALLQDPLAQELLASRKMAQLAYTWTDGSPRVVPIWFHWDGQSVVLGSPLRAPKLAALRTNPRVAVTVEDSSDWPYKALLVRGEASVDEPEGLSAEYQKAAYRYLGDEAAEQWLKQLQGAPMARITIAPEWVCLIDFVTRFPSALSA